MKLVHYHVEPCEAGMFILADAPRFRYASIVLGTNLPQRGVASTQDMSVARCLLDRKVVHLVPPINVENVLFPLRKQSFARERDVAYRQLSRSDASECDRNPMSVLAGMFSSPLGTRAWYARCLKRPGWSGAGSPVLQALILIRQRLT